MYFAIEIPRRCYFLVLVRRGLSPPPEFLCHDALLLLRRRPFVRARGAWAFDAEAREAIFLSRRSYVYRNTTIIIIKFWLRRCRNYESIL